jgi:hypothetical protein
VLIQISGRLPGGEYIASFWYILTNRFSSTPKIALKLRAPLELENLLPYNLQYRVYDKNTNQNWKSYLRQGGVMPVHSVEQGHLVLLNVELEDTGTIHIDSEVILIRMAHRSLRSAERLRNYKH